VSNKRPRSHQGAYTQAYYFMLRRVNGCDQNTRQLIAKRAGKIISTIWRNDQVGIFQLRRKNIVNYYENKLVNFQKHEGLSYEIATKRLLHELGKDHWLPITRKDV